MLVPLSSLTSGRETYALILHRLRCPRRAARSAFGLFLLPSEQADGATMAFPLHQSAVPEALDTIWVWGAIALWAITLAAVGLHYARRARQQHARLQQQDRYFRALIENAADLITVVDNAGVIRYQSPSSTTLLGHPPEVLTGRSLLDFVHPNDHDQLSLAQEAQPDRSASTIRVRHKNDQWRVLSISATSIHDVSGAPVLVYNARDVTQEQQAQEDIATQQRFLREVIDTIPHLIFAKDPEGRFTLANQALAKLTGLSVDDILGKTDLEINVSPEDAARFRRDDQEVLNTRSEKRILDEPLTIVDGRTHWYRAIKRPLFDVQGAVRQVLGISFEITEIKEHEEQLRRLLNERTLQQAELLRVNKALKTEVTERLAAEQRLAAVLDTVGEGIITIDTDDRIVMVNTAVETMWGYTREELLGQPATLLMPSSYRRRHISGLKHHLETGTNTMIGQWVEVEGLRKNGQTFPLETYISRTPVGDQILFTAAVRDITAQKAAKHQLESQHAFLRHVIDTSPNLIYTTDADGCFALANAATADLFGTTVDALIGTPKRNAPISEEELRPCLETDEQILRTHETLTFTEQITPPGGPTYSFHTVKTPIELADGSTAVLAISTDITPLMRKEEELYDKRAFLRKVIDAHPHFIFAKNRQGRYTLANLRVAEQYGCPIQTVIGSTHKELNPDTQALGLLSDEEVAIFDSKHIIHQPEVAAVDADGNQQWFSVMKIPMLNEAGNVTQVLGITIDITAQKESEQRLRDAMHAAEELATLKSAFLANMSHEIRTPLTGIIGFASILGEEVTGEQQELAHLIELNGQRLLQTLNSVLDLSMLEAGTLQLAPEPINVSQEVEQKVAMLAPLAEKKGIHLYATVPDAAAWALLDIGCFSRVLDNIIGNAVKFTEEGEVAVTVEVKGAEIYLRIKDTGIGISADFLPHLFDEFRQENMSMTRNHEGTGLGLSITKRLIDLMGGTISIKSALNEGTEVTVVFDSWKPPAEVAPTTDAAGLPDAMSHGGRILVVEDNAFAQSLFGHLTDVGYDVRIAGNAHEAYNLLEAETFDMILMDIHLGDGQTGVDVLHQVRTHFEAPTLPVAAVTAYGLPGDRERFLEAGFTAYLSKPFTWHQLLRLVQQLERP